MEKDFYAYVRIENGFDWLKHSGTVVDNEFGFDLYAYHSKESYDKEKYWWYVVEGKTGTAFGRGHTRAEAIKLAKQAIEFRGVESIKEQINTWCDKYGESPLYRPTFL